jgi:TPR repeat protein
VHTVRRLENPQSAEGAEKISSLKQSANHGQTKMQNRRGFCYQVDKGVPKDEAKAVWWYQLAAGRNHAGVQYRLGQR